TDAVKSGAGGYPPSRVIARQPREPQRKRTRFSLVSVLRVVSPSKRMKPDTGGRDSGVAAIGLSGVVGGGAWGQTSRGTWETRKFFFAGVGQPIVARKRVMIVERRGRM